MRFRFMRGSFFGGLFTWTAFALVTASPAQAQEVVPTSGRCVAPTPNYPCPAPIPAGPGLPYMPGAGPDNVVPPTPNPNPNPAPNPNPVGPDNTAETPAGQDFAFAGSQGLASGAQTFGSPGGYLDDAIPQSVFKLRYDSESGINRFDRASYMFGTWREGSFHAHALVGDGGVRGTFLDPKATGTQIISNNVDDQILSASLEYAFGQRLSVFVDLPFQFVHFRPDIEDGPESAAERRQFPETEVRNPNQDPSGVGDVQVGFKYAFIAEPNCRYLTFQFRTYVPTGDPGLGLGTGHYSVEPGLLAYQRLTDRLVIQGELTDWIPLAGGQGAGNVITYGGGIGYDVIQRCKLRVTPVAEVVGWTVLGGTEAFDGTVPAPTVTTATGVTAVNVNGTLVPDDHGFLEANGDTIINLKVGVRTSVGERSDLYVGYGRAVTGSRWYQDIFSVQYRFHF